MKSLLLALVASLGILSASSVAGAQEPAGIISVRFDTGASSAAKRAPKLHAQKHQAHAPVARKVWEVQDGCATRTLEGDASGQTVTICDNTQRASYDPDTL